MVCSQGLRSVGSKVLEPATFEASPLFVLCSPAVFRPIFAFAKMIINPTAEMELTMPKLDLHLEVQDIAIEMNRGQVRQTGGRKPGVEHHVVTHVYLPSVSVHAGAAGVCRLYGEKRPLQEVPSKCFCSQELQTLVRLLKFCSSNVSC